MVGAGSAAKKAGKRRISFRPQNSDSNNEQDGGSQQEEEVEQAGADDAEDTMLSADNIEEDEAPEPAAPLSSEACHYCCLLSLHLEPVFCQHGSQNCMPAVRLCRSGSSELCVDHLQAEYEFITRCITVPLAVRCKDAIPPFLHTMSPGSCIIGPFWDPVAAQEDLAIC